MNTTTFSVDLRYSGQELMALFAVARHQDVDQGGRYDARSAAINVWSHHWQHPATHHDSELIGTFYFHWTEPIGLYQIECDAGFSLEDLLRELGTLELGALGHLQHGLAEASARQVSCRWCDMLNPVTTPVCTDCGHDAHRPRLWCLCAQCQRAQP